MGTSNYTDVTVTSLTVNSYPFSEPTVTALTGNATVTSASGRVVTLNKATAITVTLSNPTATTDDGKRITFVSLNNVQHVINMAGGFGNGSTGEDAATFSGVIGDNLTVMAWQGYWYIVGNHQVTVA